MKSKIILILGILLALSLVMSCGSKKSTEIVITVGQSTDPIILDPPMYSDTPTHNINLILYNQ